MINSGLRQVPKAVKKAFSISAVIYETKDGVIK
jgi:hypothetical protein